MKKEFQLKLDNLGNLADDDSKTKEYQLGLLTLFNKTK